MQTVAETQTKLIRAMKSNSRNHQRFLWNKNFFITVIFFDCVIKNQIDFADSIHICV